jgi:peroxiredoxin
LYYIYSSLQRVELKILQSFFAFLILLSSVLVSCDDEKTSTSNSFKIIGSVGNIPDSSIVILQANNINLDSALVLNEKFELTGKLDEPANAFLFIPSTNDYGFLWVENAEIIFNAESGNFLNAKITGSQTQVENDKLLVKESLIITKRDSLENLLYGGKTNLGSDVIRKELNELQKDLKQEYISVIKNNPASYVSAFILNVYKTTWGKEQVEPLYQAFNEKIKYSSYGQSIKSYLELNVIPKVGDKYADFESTDTNSKTVKLSDIKAKAVLLDFWASWCFPCKEENKNLVKVYSDYKKYGFEIFGVSGDNKKESWLEVIKKDRLIWTNVFDGEGTDSKPFLIYDINGIPDNFLINSEGIIVARNLRGNELRKKLDELLK